MPTGAKIGYPTLFKRGNAASPEVFTTIAEVKGVSGFGGRRELLEATNFDSLLFYKEFIAAMKEGVEFTITLNFLPANATQSLAAGILKDFEDGVTRNFQMQIQSYSPFYTFSFAGLVTGWNIPDLTPNAVITGTVTIKITGAITGA